jgi:ABC-type methionine transport system permease subunit
MSLKLSSFSSSSSSSDGGGGGGGLGESDCRFSRCFQKFSDTIQQKVFVIVLSMSKKREDRTSERFTRYTESFVSVCVKVFVF